MKTEIINLSQLPLNKSGKIKNINCDEGIKRRLLVKPSPSYGLTYLDSIPGICAIC